MDQLGYKFLNLPVEVFLSSLAFFIYLILLIPLYLKRRKNEQQDQPNQVGQLPKSLESLLMNFGIITVNILVWLTLYLMNRYLQVRFLQKGLISFPKFTSEMLKNQWLEDRCLAEVHF